MCIFICSLYEFGGYSAPLYRLGNEGVVDYEGAPAEQIRNEGIMAVNRHGETMLVMEMSDIEIHVCVC